MVDRKALALLAIVAAPSIALAACVTKDKYEAAVQDAQSTHAALSATQEQEKAREAEIARLRDALSDAQGQMQARDQKLSEADKDLVAGVVYKPIDQSQIDNAVKQALSAA